MWPFNEGQPPRDSALDAVFKQLDIKKQFKSYYIENYGAHSKKKKEKYSTEEISAIEERLPEVRGRLETSYDELNRRFQEIRKKPFSDTAYDDMLVFDDVTQDERGELQTLYYEWKNTEIEILVVEGLLKIAKDNELMGEDRQEEQPDTDAPELPPYDGDPTGYWTGEGSTMPVKEKKQDGGLDKAMAQVDKKLLKDGADDEKMDKIQAKLERRDREKETIAGNVKAFGRSLIGYDFWSETGARAVYDRFKNAYNLVDQVLQHKTATEGIVEGDPAYEASQERLAAALQKIESLRGRITPEQYEKLKSALEAHDAADAEKKEEIRQTLEVEHKERLNSMRRVLLQNVQGVLTTLAGVVTLGGAGLAAVGVQGAAAMATTIGSSKLVASAAAVVPRAYFEAKANKFKSIKEGGTGNGIGYGWDEFNSRLSDANGFFGKAGVLGGKALWMASYALPLLGGILSADGMDGDSSIARVISEKISALKTQLGELAGSANLPGFGRVLEEAPSVESGAPVEGQGSGGETLATQAAPAEVAAPVGVAPAEVVAPVEGAASPLGVAPAEAAPVVEATPEPLNVEVKPNDGGIRISRGLVSLANQNSGTESPLLQHLAQFNLNGADLAQELGWYAPGSDLDSLALDAEATLRIEGEQIILENRGETAVFELKGGKLVKIEGEITMFDSNPVVETTAASDLGLRASDGIPGAFDQIAADSLARMYDIGDTLGATGAAEGLQLSELNVPSSVQEYVNQPLFEHITDPSRLERIFDESVYGEVTPFRLNNIDSTNFWGYEFDLPNNNGSIYLSVEMGSGDVTLLRQLEDGSFGSQTFMYTEGTAPQNLEEAMKRVTYEAQGGARIFTDPLTNSAERISNLDTVDPRILEGLIQPPTPNYLADIAAELNTGVNGNDFLTLDARLLNTLLPDAQFGTISEFTSQIPGATSAFQVSHSGLTVVVNILADRIVLTDTATMLPFNIDGVPGITVGDALPRTNAGFLAALEATKQLLNQR